MLKNLEKNVAFPSDSIHVKMSDISKQQSLIDDGWVGVSLEKNDEEWEITYKISK